MFYPNFLKKNATIGLFAPSFGANIDPYKSRLIHAIKRFESLGYNFVESGDIYGYHNGASDTPKNRAVAFTALYKNPNIDFIWSVGGGELMMEMLGFIDFEDLKNYPAKYVMGYSDNTNLTFLMSTLLDTASIYGQNITEFGMTSLDVSLTQAIEVISGEQLFQYSLPLHEHRDVSSEDPHASYNLTEQTYWYNLQGQPSIELKGRFIGGCLDILVMHVGTKFDKVSHFTKKYDKDNIIWYLEACDLNIFAYKRALWQLKEAGWFENAKGFIFGRPLMMSPLLDLDQYSVTKDILGDLNVPIIMDADIGHVQPTLTIINGAYVNVKSEKGIGSIEIILK